MPEALQMETRLPIRVRRTIDGSGEIAAVMLVYCEARKRSVPLDECTECDHCETVRIDPLEEDSWVICSRGASFPSPFAVAEASGDRTPVASIMSRRAICVAPDTQTSIVRELLLERGLTGAPVVDASGTVVGFISRSDLLRNRWPAPPVTVAHIMTPLALTVSETSSIAEASAVMAMEGVHRLPVVSNSGSHKVVGVICALDILRWYARKQGYLREGLRTGN